MFGLEIRKLVYNEWWILKGGMGNGEWGILRFRVTSIPHSPFPIPQLNFKIPRLNMACRDPGTSDSSIFLYLFVALTLGRSLEY